MKVIYITRLFTGLMGSVNQKSWEPSGVPTIYKMLEALGDKHHCIALLLPKGGYVQNKINKLTFPQIRTFFYILPSEHVFPISLGRKINYVLRELIQFYHVHKIIRREKPDLLYVDHANVLIAAFYAHFYRKCPVVFRLMGCFGVRSSFETRNLFTHLFRWGYRSPFAAVICTQEGSNVEYWLNRALAPGVPVHVMLNGVDSPKDVPIDEAITRLPKNKTKVVSVGRLDPDKSADDFLKAFLIAWRREPEHLHAVIIGTGSRKQAMLDEIKLAGAGDSVTFIERLAHEQIPLVHQHTDIYVSLNRAGNLSNANLEAIRAGQCMIIPKSQAETGIDKIVDELLSDRAVYRIARTDDVNEIADAIHRLHLNPQARADMSAQIIRESAKFLYSWNERIQNELTILEGLVASGKNVRIDKENEQWF